MKVSVYLSIIGFGILSAISSDGMQADPNYQQNGSINTNSTSANNTSSKLNQQEVVFDLGSLEIKNEKNEPSNRELLENAGFTFSGLPNEKNTRSAINGGNDIKIPPEMLPIILKMINNNADANAQKAQNVMDNVLNEMSKSKNPIVQQGSSCVKGILSSIGLGGSSAAGSIGGQVLTGTVTLIVLVVLKKFDWI